MMVLLPLLIKRTLRKRSEFHLHVNIVCYTHETCLRSYIFTMDSLGSKHPQATKLLQTYLQLEASDKKGIKDAGKAEGKRAQVSTEVIDAPPFD